MRSHIEKNLPFYFTSALIAFLVRHGADPKALLAGTDLTLEAVNSPETRTDFGTITSIIERGLEIWGRPGLGQAFGRSLTVTSLGILGQASASSDTVGDGMRTIARYLAIRQPMLQFKIEDTSTGAWFIFDDSIDLGHVRAFVAEAALFGTLSFAWQLAGIETEGHRFTFQQPGLSTHEEIRYGARRDAVFLPAHLLAQPVPTASPINAAEAKRLCEIEIAHLRETEGLPGAVRELILSRLSNPLSERDAASILGVSERGLRRKLKDQNTSFRGLHQGIRRKMALHYLRHTHMQIGQIAKELGYENVGNFCRSFKTWTGESPTQARRSL